MLLRMGSLRRSVKPKILLVSLVLVTFLLSIKFISSNNPNSYRNGGDGSDELAAVLEPEAAAVVGNVIDDNVSNDASVPQAITPTSNVPTKSDRSNYELQIRADLAKQQAGLGNEGEPVVLSGEAKIIGDRQLTKIALNEELSETLSYNRTVQDARNPLCHKQIFNLDTLPTSSVVIIFYNEPYSVLLRTVHSVLNTVDKRILKDVILVDDASTHPELHGKLDYYLETRIPKGAVKMVRLPSRWVGLRLLFFFVCFGQSFGKC